MKSNRHWIACVLLGCTPGGESSSSSGEAAGADEGVATPGALAEPDPVPAEPPGVALPRGLGHETSISEIWLDPRASAALSLDAAGGVRLWPALPPAQTDLVALAPIRVPLREPLTLSLARADTHEFPEFVIAAIDTAQAARVIAIRLDAEGRASVRERFTIPPSDPLLELHVLDGGDRLLALGVDHRIRLYDGQGNQLAELAEYGLSPWQLRFAGPPESLQIAMVLAGPTRLQRLAIADDRITRVGEPRPFTLGRGPNANDLALLPSGRVAALLRRPSTKTTQWSLELHDLDSGEVRILWGEAVAELRPRMHVIDDERVLLEDGSGGGFWIDLRSAVVMPAPFMLPETLELLPPESHVIGHRVELPGSNQGTRRKASVVAGLRVAPLGSDLVFDPIDGDRHHRLGHRAIGTHALALDGEGTRIARSGYQGSIVVESLVDRSEHVVVGCTVDGFEQVVFSDRDHLVVLGSTRAKICAWRTGELISEVELPAFASAGIRIADPGSGQLAIRLQEEFTGEEDEDPPTRISRTSFTNNQFGPIEPLAKAELPSWAELDPDTRVLALDRTGQRYIRSKVDTRHFEIAPAEGPRRKLVIADRLVAIEQLEPSPDGRWAAIIHRPGVKPQYAGGYSEYADYGAYGGYGPSTLSVWSIAGEIPEPMWSTQAQGSVELSWSADGSKLAFDEPTGIRVVTPEGQDIVEPGRRDFHLDELPDVPAPSSP